MNPLALTFDLVASLVAGLTFAVAIVGGEVLLDPGAAFLPNAVVLFSAVGAACLGGLLARVALPRAHAWGWEAWDAREARRRRAGSRRRRSPTSVPTPSMRGNRSRVLNPTPTGERSGRSPRRRAPVPSIS